MKDLLDHKKVSIKNANEVDDIITPLVKVLDTPGFSYQRLYPNGERIFLSNSSIWIENYFEKEYYKTLSYQKCYQLPTYMLWAHWPKEDRKIFELIRDAYK